MNDDVLLWHLYGELVTVRLTSIMLGESHGDSIFEGAKRDPIAEIQAAVSCSQNKALIDNCPATVTFEPTKLGNVDFEHHANNPWPGIGRCLSAANNSVARRTATGRQSRGDIISSSEELEARFRALLTDSS